MTITRHNCEAAFLDYYEKILSPMEVAEVLFFLEENSDLKEVFESYQAIFLGEDKIKFPNKEILKKIGNSEELESALSSEISKSNCERFFVASAEGVLSESQNEKLQIFLVKHPDLKGDYELFKKCKLSAEQISYDNKELLKRGVVNSHNREEFFIRAIESDLSTSEQKQLGQFLNSNPIFEKEFQLFKHTVLVPETIVFQFKSELKREKHKPVFIAIFSQRTAYYAAAAAILLLAGLFFLFKSDDTQATFLADANDSQKNQSVNLKKREVQQSTIEVKENFDFKKDEVIGGNNSNKKLPLDHKLIVPQANSEEQTVPPTQPEMSDEKSMLAKKAEEKKLEQPVIEEIVIAKKEVTAIDTTALSVVQNEVVAIIPASTQHKEEYQTVASILNKKIRSILRIEKANDCDSSDKIGLWDLAMVAKRSVQKIVGAKTLDVNKVCEGSGGKVEYVFVAGKLEISKTAYR